MTIPIEYTTVKETYQTEYIVEKSKFIATVIPCNSEEEAQQAIATLKKKYWDATHNCTAFAIGPRQEQQRSSDDGEPSGTAGKPILEVIKKSGITNVAIVVTRYFGGIKLGAGGLIRAYAHSAAIGLQGAQHLLHAPRQRIAVTIDYSLYGSLERWLQEHNYTFETSFLEKVTLHILCPPEEVTQLEEQITNITQSAHQWELGDIDFVDIPQNKKEDATK